MILDVCYYSEDRKGDCYLSVSQMIIKTILNKDVTQRDLKILSRGEEGIVGLGNILTEYGFMFERILVLTDVPNGMNPFKYYADKVLERGKVSLMIEEVIKNRKTPIVGLIDVHELENYYQKDTLENIIMPYHFNNNTLHCLLIFGFDDNFFYLHDPVLGKNLAYPKENLKYFVTYLLSLNYKQIGR